MILWRSFNRYRALIMKAFTMGVACRTLDLLLRFVPIWVENLLYH